MKLIWLSDLHLVAAGDTIYRRDPTKQLQRAIDCINEHHTDASYCVLSGDLVNDGDAEIYRHLSQMLTGLQIPYLPMAGNHDNRDLLKQFLELPQSLETDFIQYAVQAGQWRVLLLDTLRDGHSDGELCDARIQWLEAELQRDRTSPTLVFTHHPLLPLKLPMQDQDSLKSGEQLLSMLQSAGNIRHWCFGHVHRPVSGSFDGLGFTAIQSVAMQAPLPYPPWDWDTFEPAEELPAFGIIHLERKSAVVHFQQFHVN